MNEIVSGFAIKMRHTNLIKNLKSQCRIQSKSVRVWLKWVSGRYSRPEICPADPRLTIIYHMRSPKNRPVGMGTLRILRFGSQFCFYGFLNGLLMTFLGYETTQWNAWLNLPELESSWKFLYTSSLATFSTLRRLLSIVKVGRVPDLRDFEMAVRSSRLADIVRTARR